MLAKDDDALVVARQEAERVRARVNKKIVAEAKSFHSKQIKARVKELRKATLAVESEASEDALAALKQCVVSCLAPVRGLLPCDISPPLWSCVHSLKIPLPLCCRVIGSTVS